MVKHCNTWARKRIKIRKHAMELKLFPATDSLTYVSFDILGPRIKSNNRSNELFTLTNHFSKVTKTLLSRTTEAEDIAKKHTKHSIFLLGLPRKHLANNGRQFTSRVFTDLSHILDIAIFYITTYHLQTNDEAKQFSCICSIGCWASRPSSMCR